MRALRSILAAAALAGPGGCKSPAPKPSAPPPPLPIYSGPVARLFVQSNFPPGTSEGLARALENELITALENTGRFRPVGLEDVESLLDKEQMAAALKDCDSTKCFAEIAQAMGARFLVVFDLHPVGSQNVLSLRMLDGLDMVSRGRWTGRVAVHDEDGLLGAIVRGARGLATRYERSAEPADASATEGRLHILGPAGATVTVDGIGRGTAPLNVVVPIGLHRIEVKQRDVGREGRWIIVDGDTLEFDLELRKLPTNAGGPGVEVAYPEWVMRGSGVSEDSTRVVAVAAVSGLPPFLDRIALGAFELGELARLAELFGLASTPAPSSDAPAPQIITTTYQTSGFATQFRAHWAHPMDGTLYGLVSTERSSLVSSPPDGSAPSLPQPPSFELTDGAAPVEHTTSSEAGTHGAPAMNASPCRFYRTRLRTPSGFNLIESPIEQRYANPAEPSWLRGDVPEGIVRGIGCHDRLQIVADTLALVEVLQQTPTAVRSTLRDFAASTVAGDFTASNEEQHVEQDTLAYGDYWLDPTVRFYIRDRWIRPDGTLCSVLDVPQADVSQMLANPKPSLVQIDEALRAGTRQAVTEARDELRRLAMSHVAFAIEISQQSTIAGDFSSSREQQDVEMKLVAPGIVWLVKHHASGDFSNPRIEECVRSPDDYKFTLPSGQKIAIVEIEAKLEALGSD